MTIEEGLPCSICGYPARVGHAASCSGKGARLESTEARASIEQKITQTLSQEDLAVLYRVVETVGSADKLFNPRGKFLHTTDNLSFAQILQSGSIITDDVFPGGSQRTPGASFTDGNFPEATSFQLLYDNVPGGGREKLLHSDKYAEALGGSTTENFMGYFWDNHPTDARSYLAELAKKIPDDTLSRMGIQPDRVIVSKEQALAIGRHFIPKGRGDFGVTIAYDGEKRDEIGIEERGTVGLQQYFEKRSFKSGGVPLSEASVILVPSVRVEEVKRQLAEGGITSVDVRSSEELEVRRILEKINL